MQVSITETREFIYDVPETDPEKAADEVRRMHVEHPETHTGEDKVTERYYVVGNVEAGTVYCDQDLDRKFGESVVTETNEDGHLHA